MAKPPPVQQCRWHVTRDARAMYAAVAERTLAAADQAVQQRGHFVIVLAGGNTPRGVYELLCSGAANWSKWHVYFGDERCAPRDDPARNSRMAEAAWLGHVPIPARQVHEMPAELGPIEAAKRYAATLESVGEFDLVLLGLGEDGHTGSLFPAHDPGRCANAPSVLAVLDAPKPPAHRVTMSARRFSRTKEAIFIVTGEEKREAVQRWRAGKCLSACATTPRTGVDVFVGGAILQSS